MCVGCDLFAYIDPMSGAILLQLLIAAVVGTGLFFRRAIWRLGRLFTRRDAKSREETELDESTEE